jgi:hypothetical protein
VQERRECLNRGRRALRMDDHSAVVFVAHPAHHTKLAASISHGGPETNTLDSPGHRRTDRTRSRRGTGHVAQGIDSE